jgi:hypothetical protein
LVGGDGRSFDLEDPEMSHKLSAFAVAAALSLLPGELLAGGPPRLCLPIAGVTADNASACAKLIRDGLGDKRGLRAPVEVRRHEGQAYVVFPFNVERLKLSNVEAALEGSAFSIPREKLRVFGLVTLEIEVGKAPTDGLIRDLAALEHVAVDESARDKGMLRVTLKTPYSFTRDIFAELERAENAPQSDSRATVRTLPRYVVLRDIATKHDSTLRDLHWECWGCRVLGCVAEGAGDRQ